MHVQQEKDRQHWRRRHRSYEETNLPLMRSDACGKRRRGTNCW